MFLLIPPEGFGGICNHSDAQLDGLADRKGQVLITITEICDIYREHIQSTVKLVQQ